MPDSKAVKYDDNNIFARIIRGEIPCDKVFEDDHVLSFHDIGPQAPTHILVIPKKPYVDVADFGANAEPEEITSFWRAVSYIAEEYTLTDKGFRIISNAGAYGGQEVPHFHVHILGGKPLGPMLSKQG